MKVVLAISALLGLLTACGGGGMPGVPTPEERRPLAIHRAASELACEESQLSARYLGERLFHVSGCGRQATYRVICKFTVGSCYLVGGPGEQS